MWAVGENGAGDIRLHDSGYEPAPATESQLLFLAKPEEGAYHHHQIITHHGDTFYVSFSESLYGEDSPGQRVLTMVSKNGRSWSKPVITVESLDDYSRQWKDDGVFGQPDVWITFDGRVWLVCDIFQRVTVRKGSDGKNSRESSNWSGFPKQSTDIIGSVASEVSPDGSMGEQFWVTDRVPAGVREPFASKYPAIGDPRFEPIRKSFLEVFERHKTRIGPESRLKNTLVGVDGHNLCEHALYRRPDGKWVQLARDLQYSHRLYFALSDDGDDFSTPVPTDIPDAPALPTAGSLPDGRNFIIGNFVHNPETNTTKRHYRRYPLVIALSNDGKVFDRAYAIRAERTTPRFDVGGSADGYSYPDAIVLGDVLWVVYSINKQDIALSRIYWKHL